MFLILVFGSTNPLAAGLDLLCQALLAVAPEPGDRCVWVFFVCLFLLLLFWFILIYIYLLGVFYLLWSSFLLVFLAFGVGI